VTTTTLFHCSDLHFGHPAVPEQYEAIETLIQERTYDVVAISATCPSGLAPASSRGAAFIRHAERVSKVIAVPGTTTWRGGPSPLRLGNDDALLWKYRQYISRDVEPVLRLPGAVIVGLNTAHGVIRQTLTWNPRDIRSWVTWARNRSNGCARS